MSKKLHLSPRSRVFRAVASGAALAAMSALTGCALLFDYSDLAAPSEDEGSQGGQEGTGGTGGNNGGPCKPGTQQACYGGPPGTMMVGACTQGTQTCKSDGSSFGPCEGQVLPQVEDCATDIDESCDNRLDDGPQVCSASVAWANQLTGMGAQVPLASAVDIMGNTVIAGYFEEAADVGGKMLQSDEMADAFVAKFDSDGVNVFSVSFGGPEHQEARGIATDKGGNTIVVGSFSGSIHFGGGGAVPSKGASDIYVAKLNSDGVKLWDYQFGDISNQHVTSVATDEQGNIFMAGYFEGTLDFSGGVSPLVSAGSTDAFLVKLTQNGAHVWSRRFGDELAQGAEGVAVDKMGQVLLAGWFAGSMDLGNGELNTLDTDGFVAKFAPEAGSLTWSSAIGGMGNARALGVAADEVGSVIATGYFTGLVTFDGGGAMPGTANEDMFVVKYLDKGTYVWNIKIGSASDERGMSVATDGQSNIIVSGFLGGSPDLSGFSVSGAGGADAFLGKLDPNGAPIWLKTAGDAANDAGTSVAISPEDDVIWTGHFDGEIRLGNKDLASGGTTDGFVAKVLE